MNASQVTADMEAFSAPAPEVAAKLAKEAEAHKKKLEAASKALKPEQLKMAQKLTDQMNEEQQAVAKADLMQQLADYIKLVEEYHPERVDYLKTKKVTPKMTVEELRMAIRDVQRELGKKGGLEIAKVAWVNLFRTVEQINEDNWMGFNSTDAGRFGEQLLLDRRMPNGDVVPGPVVPTLAEFVCKYPNWFSTSVEWRLGFEIYNCFATLHRINTGAGINVATAKATPVSKETADLAKKL